MKVVRNLFNTLQSSSAGRPFSGGVAKTAKYALKFVGWQAVYEGGVKLSITICFACDLYSTIVGFNFSLFQITFDVCFCLGMI